MLEGLVRYKWNIFALAAIWLVFECVVSWVAFCEYPTRYSPAYEATEEYGCIFKGPVASGTRALFGWLNHVFDGPDAYIALFTAILAWSTITLWLTTRRSTRIAERVLTELERPYLFILDYNWLLIEKAKANGNKCGVSYSVVNGGKPPAFIRAVKFGLQFGTAIPPLDEAPPVHELLTAPLIAGGEKRLITQHFITNKADDPPRECEIRDGIAFIPAIAFQSDRVIAKISVEYDGPTTRGHVTTACWEWHPIKYAFTEYGGSEHNQRT